MNKGPKPGQDHFERLVVECRQMWKDFDPIGVYHLDGDWPEDEYDSYALQSVSLLVKRADLSEIGAFVRSAVHDTMGMPDTPDEMIATFAENLKTLDI